MRHALEERTLVAVSRNAPARAPRRLILSLAVAIVTAVCRASAAAAAQPPLEPARTAADLPLALSCPAIHFSAYSTLAARGARVEESLDWDPAQQAYLIRGPILSAMLNDPGVAEFPSDADTLQTLFRIAVRKELSKPVDRFCEYGFQESAECTDRGEVLYTQIYTGCDLQTLKHVTRLKPDNAGALQLLDLSFSDLGGDFSPPRYLSAGSDLRLRIRN
jgi:hypothetical protein